MTGVQTFYTVLCLLLSVVRTTVCEITLDISMPNDIIAEEDDYICSTFVIDGLDKGYLRKVHYEIDTDVVHHFSLAACDNPRSLDYEWECKETQGSNCNGSGVWIGRWDTHVNSRMDFTFPEGSSVEVGSAVKYKYIIAQVHYKHMINDNAETHAKAIYTLTEEPTPYNWQIYLMASYGYIPENTELGYMAHIACRWDSPRALAYRATGHTHNNGLLVEAYLVRNRTWILLGSYMPHNPTVVRRNFDISGGPIEILPGDMLAGKCLYINDNDRRIYFGMNDSDEMCNLEIEIGFDSSSTEESQTRELSCFKPSPEYSFCDEPEALLEC